MILGRIFIGFAAVACWWIAVMWIVGGFRVARSYAATQETVEMNDVLRVMFLRSVGLALVGVQIFLVVFGRPPSLELSTFWPGVIGVILFEAGRFYMIYSKRAGRKAFR